MRFRWPTQKQVYRWLVVGILPILLAGCNSTGGLSAADYERANSALEQALTAWKNGDPAKKWTAEKAPVRFVDDEWIKGSRLIDYSILQIRANADGYPEALVRLDLQKGKNAEKLTQEALYGINIKKADQVIIGRDPMQ